MEQGAEKGTAGDRLFNRGRFLNVHKFYQWFIGRLQSGIAGFDFSSKPVSHCWIALLAATGVDGKFSFFRQCP